MSSQPLPYWYLHADGREDASIPEDQWEGLIDERILLFKDGNHKNLEFGLSIMDKQELGNKERRAFTILKLAVCLDPRLSVWLVEQEGDLFEQEFRNLSWRDKKLIMDTLYLPLRGKPTWIELDELNMESEVDIYDLLDLNKLSTQRFHSKNPMYKSVIVEDNKGMGKYIAIDFKYASELMKTRKAVLYDGWIIGKTSRFITTIKHYYQQRIEDSLTDFATRLENPKNHHMKKVAERVNELLQEKVEFRRSSSNIGNIKIIGSVDDNQSILPPCIEDLLNSVNEVGYIGHWERLQLGIFLKQTGMDVDEQLQFWYGKAVDNVNMSYDDFLRKAGYVIRHIYGLEGGRVDYQMPTCKTIQAKMYCSFRHGDIEHVNRRVVAKLNILPKDNLIEIEIKKGVGKRILDASSSGLPSIACAYHLELVAGVKVDGINHPLYYLKRAGYVLGGYTEEEVVKGGEEVE